MKIKRYWPWVALGVLVLVPAGVQLIRPRYWGCGGPIPPRDIATIIQSLNEYSINNIGAYPCSLAAIVTPDQDGHCYLEGFDGHIPRDPWKREYLYVAPTPDHPKPRVLCLGADGRLGGEDDDADYDSDTLADPDR